MKMNFFVVSRPLSSVAHALVGDEQSFPSSPVVARYATSAGLAHEPSGVQTPEVREQSACSEQPVHLFVPVSQTGAAVGSHVLLSMQATQTPGSSLHTGVPGSWQS